LEINQEIYASKPDISRLKIRIAILKKELEQEKAINNPGEDSIWSLLKDRMFYTQKLEELNQTLTDENNTLRDYSDVQRKNTTLKKENFELTERNQYLEAKVGELKKKNRLHKASRIERITFEKTKVKMEYSDSIFDAE
jgi:hypothetical protein